MKEYTPDFTEKDCVWEYNGYKHILNYNVAIRQKVDKKALQDLQETHNRKQNLFEEMEKTDDPNELKRLAKEVTDIYYEQQDLWKFKRDNKYHCFWEMPKCICPKMDNYERLGINSKIYTTDCPIHGIKESDEQNNS